MTVSPGQGRVLFEGASAALELRAKLKALREELTTLKATIKLAEAQLEAAYSNLDNATTGVMGGVEPLPLFPQ